MGSSDWIKASSSANIHACIELRRSGDRIAVRNSREPQPELAFTREEFAAFLDGARRGEFDHLLDP